MFLLGMISAIPDTIIIGAVSWDGASLLEARVGQECAPLSPYHQIKSCCICLMVMCLVLIVSFGF